MSSKVISIAHQSINNSCNNSQFLLQQSLSKKGINIDPICLNTKNRPIYCKLQERIASRNLKKQGIKEAINSRKDILNDESPKSLNNDFKQSSKSQSSSNNETVGTNSIADTSRKYHCDQVNSNIANKTSQELCLKGIKTKTTSPAKDRKNKESKGTIKDHDENENTTSKSHISPCLTDYNLGYNKDYKMEKVNCLSQNEDRGKRIRVKFHKTKFRNSLLPNIVSKDELSKNSQNENNAEIKPQQNNFITVQSQNREICQSQASYKNISCPSPNTNSSSINCNSKSPNKVSINDKTSQLMCNSFIFSEKLSHLNVKEIKNYCSKDKNENVHKDEEEEKKKRDMKKAEMIRKKSGGCFAFFCS